MKKLAKIEKPAKRRHVGPNHKVVSLYAEKKLLLKMKMRAASLNMTLAKYIHYLAKKDLNEPSDFTLVPLSKP